MGGGGACSPADLAALPEPGAPAGGLQPFPWQQAIEAIGARAARPLPAAR